MQKLRQREFMKPIQGSVTDDKGLMLPENLMPVHVTIALYFFLLFKVTYIYFQKDKRNEISKLSKKCSTFSISF